VVDALRHDEGPRRDIPAAEYEAMRMEETSQPVRVFFDRRDQELEPASRLARQGLAAWHGVHDRKGG
jgi:hypothetical protein